MKTARLLLLLCPLLFHPVHAAPPTGADEAQDFVAAVAAEMQKKTGQAPEPEELVGVLNRIVVELFTDGQYREAIELARQTWQYAEQKLGEKHQESLAALNNLGQLHQSVGQYEAAQPLLQRALRVSEEVLGKEHPQTLTNVSNLATLYVYQGRYDEAESLLQHALRVREKALGKEHPDTLISVNNLAFLYQAQGRYEEAEQRYQYALDLSKKTLGPEHTQTLSFIHNMAFLYQSQGRYGEAESLYQHLIKIRERVLGQEHLETLRSINNLAVLYESQERYDEAVPLYERVLGIQKQILGLEHPDTLQTINNIAALYSSLGRYNEAEILHQRALNGRENILGEEHPKTIESINNLAVVYEFMGIYSKAESLYQRALHICERVLGEEHPDTLLSVNNLAVFYKVRGKHGKAESMYQHALHIGERVLGKKHPQNMIVMQNLIGLHLEMNKPQKALGLLKRLQTAVLGYAAVELSTTLGEAQKRRFLTQQTILQDFALSLAMQHPSAETNQFAATVLLRWNQVQAEETAYLQRLSRHADDPEIQQLAEKIRVARSELSFLANQKNAQPEALQTRLAELDNLEVQLSAHSRVYKQHLAVRELELDTVRSALPRYSALLAIKVYRPFDPEKQALQEPHYLALLLPAEDGGELRLRDLGPVKDTLARGALLKDGAAQAEQDLYQHLFAAWDEELAKFDALYIVPDHWLHLLNFERLKLPDGRYWIERQILHRLSNARDLLRTSPKEKAKNLVAVGGIDYGPLLKDDCKNATDNRHRSITEQIQCGFKPLPATEREAKKVRGYFNAATDKGEAFLWLNANEESLKKITEAPRILHLATHGFYLEKNTWSAQPLVLSGLALAHANDGLRGETEGEDGILYAIEVLDLNLTGTELVTLSACDTGQGVVDYSEGVYGLLRAFRIAGAQQVLMSLKKLDDAKAYEFMDTFYRRWLLKEAGETHPADVLRTVKLAYISEGKSAEDWSPYVLVEAPEMNMGASPKP